MPRLSCNNQLEGGLAGRPRLECCLDEYNVGKIRQGLTCSADHFRSRIKGKNLQIPGSETLRCLTRSAADFENVVVWFQLSVRDNIVDESVGVVGA